VRSTGGDPARQPSASVRPVSKHETGGDEMGRSMMARFVVYRAPIIRRAE
jgi:hypothetical protein